MEVPNCSLIQMNCEDISNSNLICSRDELTYIAEFRNSFHKLHRAAVNNYYVQ
jgi:hypothetical protein